MKTVALITTRFVRQGPTRQLLYLIKNIDKEKVNPIIITLSKEKEPTLIEEFIKENIEIIQLNLSFIDSILYGKILLSKLVKEKKIDIIHSFCHAIRPEFLCCNLKNVYKLVTVRNVPSVSSLGASGWLFGYILYKLRMKFYKKFDKVVACSNSIGQNEELFNLNAFIIQNGIDTSVLKTAINSRSKADFKKEYSLASKKIVYLTVSNGSKTKNIDFLIKSFTEANQENRVLIIAGDESNKAQNLSDNIIFLGHTSRIFDYYQSSDFFISASFSEGLPNAVMESLLMGTPCILSDIPMHEEILVNSKNIIGVTFCNNDFKDLFEKMLWLEKNVSENTREYCRKHILENFDALKMAKKYEHLYLSINTD